MSVRGLGSKNVFIVVLALSIGCGALVRSAKSDGLPPPTSPAPPAPAGVTPLYPFDAQPLSYDPRDQFELRFGGYFHGVGSTERDTYDITASVVTPRPNFGLNEYWNNFIPRFQIGGNVNLEGRTSIAYADFVYTLTITKWLLFEPYIGGAIHNGSLVPTPTLNGLGCPLLFHVGVSFGVPITEHWRIWGTFEHLSNGNEFGVDCGTNTPGEGRNQGLNNYGIRIGYGF